MKFIITRGTAIEEKIDKLIHLAKKLEKEYREHGLTEKIYRLRSRLLVDSSNLLLISFWIQEYKEYQEKCQ